MFVNAALRMWRVFGNKGSASSMLKLWDVVARVLEAGWVVQLCVLQTPATPTCSSSIREDRDIRRMHSM